MYRDTMRIDHIAHVTRPAARSELTTSGLPSSQSSSLFLEHHSVVLTGTSIDCVESFSPLV